MHLASSPQWTTSASACTTWATSARFTDASGPNVNMLTAARYINLIRQDGHHSRHKRTCQYPATKPTERNRELTQPRQKHIECLPGPQPPRHEPVTGHERTNSKRSLQRPGDLPPPGRVRLPTVSASLPCLPPYRVRLPTVSASRPCPPHDRVRLPTVSASLPCPPPYRVRLPAVSASRPCPHPYRSITSRAAPPLNVGINRNYIALSTIVQ